MKILIKYDKEEKWVDAEDFFRYMQKKVRTSSRFKPPTLEECGTYFIEKGSYREEGESFWNFYEAKGWMVGKNKMKKWHSAAANWIKRNPKKEEEEDNPTGRMKTYKPPAWTLNDENIATPEEIAEIMKDVIKPW